VQGVRHPSCSARCRSDIAIREQADSGKPTVVAEPGRRAAEIYRAIGRRLAVKIAESART